MNLETLNQTFLSLDNQVTEPVEDNLMFNGEVEHNESPPRDDLKNESEQTTPTKAITEVEDSTPSADAPSDPQVKNVILTH